MFTDCSLCGELCRVKTKTCKLECCNFQCCASSAPAPAGAAGAAAGAAGAAGTGAGDGSPRDATGGRRGSAHGSSSSLRARCFLRPVRATGAAERDAAAAAHVLFSPAASEGDPPRVYAARERSSSSRPVWLAGDPEPPRAGGHHGGRGDGAAAAASVGIGLMPLVAEAPRGAGSWASWAGAAGDVVRDAAAAAAGEARLAPAAPGQPDGAENRRRRRREPDARSGRGCCTCVRGPGGVARGGARGHSPRDPQRGRGTGPGRPRPRHRPAPAPVDLADALLPWVHQEGLYPGLLAMAERALAGDHSAAEVSAPGYPDADGTRVHCHPIRGSDGSVILGCMMFYAAPGRSEFRRSGDSGGGGGDDGGGGTCDATAEIDAHAGAGAEEKESGS